MSLVGFAGALAQAISILAGVGGVLCWLLIAHNPLMTQIYPTAPRYHRRTWPALAVFLALWLVGLGAHKVRAWLGP